MKFVSVFIAAVVIAFAWIGPAEAAITLSPTAVEAGSTIDLGVTVSAEDQPTTSVELAFTEPSIAQGDVAFVDGWSATVDRDNDDLISSVTWNKGTIPVGESQTFTLTLTIPDDSDRIEMSALQASPDGTVVRIPASGETLELVVSGATAVSSTTTAVTSTTTLPAAEDQGEEKGNSIGFYLIVFGVVVVLVLYVRTKRRVARS